jgi:GAF domain-containing protein
MAESPPRQQQEANGPGGMVDHRGFWKVLERFAGTLVDRFELDEVMAQLGRDIAEVLGAAGAGIMLADDEGRLRFCSTSNLVLGALEQLQIELDEGPCLLAYRSGSVVLAEDLRDDDRFSRFGPRALEAGMAAVYSFPMRLDSQIVGACNLYNEAPGKFTDDQVEVGEVLADVATSYLINARDIEQKDLLTRQLQRALDSRVLIEQAKGFVTARTGMEPAESFELIRGYARRNQQQVRMVARALLCDEMPVEALRRS